MVIYYSLKIFRSFWLTQIPRLILIWLIWKMLPTYHGNFLHLLFFCLLNNLILIPWLFACGRSKASDTMIHWNVLKWQKLFLATNCSAVNHFFDCHPAWCACWPCYLLFALYGGTPFQEFVTFRSPWRVTQSPRIQVLQTTAWSNFTVLSWVNYWIGILGLWALVPFILFHCGSF